MKEDDIAHLMAAYANGEISAQDSARLQQLFAANPALKQEADEMAEVWKAINIGSHQPGENMDNAFYAMLQTEKNKLTGARVVSINLNRLKVAVGIAACLLAFFIGRQTISPEKISEYKVKTVYIKQPAVIQTIKEDKPGRLVAVRTTTTKPLETPQHNGEEVTLSPQLRSVFASERMAAATQLAAKPNLTHSELKMLEMVLNEDPNANVRLMVVNALQPKFSNTAVQQLFITALSKQDDPLIQSTIVDVLVQARSKQAVPQMLALLDDKNTAPSTQMRIKDGIESFLN